MPSNSEAKVSIPGSFVCCIAETISNTEHGHWFLLLLLSPLLSFSPHSFHILGNVHPLKVLVNDIFYCHLSRRQLDAHFQALVRKMTAILIASNTAAPLYWRFSYAVSINELFGYTVILILIMMIRTIGERSKRASCSNHAKIKTFYFLKWTKMMLNHYIFVLR